jgi:hypothetical protein
MRLGFFLTAGVAAIAAAGAFAAPTPIYKLTFQGSGTEHQVDRKQNIQDNGTCDSAEHVDVTAKMVWSAEWPGFRPAVRSALSSPTRIDGSQVEGTHVKDACGLPLAQAPEGWISETSCDEALVASSSPQLTTATRGKSVVIALTAPSFSVPVSAKCPLNVRNEQLRAHVVVALKKLQSLKRGARLTFPLGTTSPGPGDTYAATIDCSVPTKPYEGYRTADRCQDQLSWSGALTITRVS